VAEVIANDLLMLSAREEGTEGPSAAANDHKSRPAPAKLVWSAEEEFFGGLDDLPF
jgi:hypothetical protein